MTGQIWDAKDLEKACGIQTVPTKEDYLKTLCKKLGIDYLEAK